MLPEREMYKIIEIKQTAEAELLNRAGINGVDIGFKYVNGHKTDQIAIRVLVAHKRDVSPEERIPSRIEGVPTDVIEETIIPYGVRADSKRYDPLVGGISIGPCDAMWFGTLGAIVYDNTNGMPMALSSFHVMTIGPDWAAGDTMSQPGRGDGGGCAADMVGALQRAVLNGEVDGAVASITGRTHRSAIAEIGDIRGVTTAALGMSVRKRGRTTGLTYGIVDSIAATIRIDYGYGIGVRTLSNQIGIVPDSSRSQRFSSSGDSGSVIVDGSNQAAALLVGGGVKKGSRTFGSSFDRVLTALKVSLHRPAKLLVKERSAYFKPQWRSARLFEMPPRTSDDSTSSVVS